MGRGKGLSSSASLPVCSIVVTSTTLLPSCCGFTVAFMGSERDDIPSPASLQSTPCLSFRSGTAISIPSCANLSILLNAPSTYLLPINFFRTFSESSSATGKVLSVTNSLHRACFISFVMLAKIPSTSAIIFTTTTFISTVDGSSVHISSRLTRTLMRSKTSMSTDGLPAKSFAVCVVSVSEQSD